jgi:hypothetical protein
MLGNEVLEEEIVVLPFGGGKTDETGQCARHGDDAEDLGSGTAALGAEQKSEAESFVKDAGKGVSGVNGDGREKGVNLALEVVFGEIAGVGAELIPVEEAHPLLGKLREQLPVPALILGGDEGVNVGGEGGERLVRPETVEAGLAIAVLNALHEARLPDFDVFVEVGGGDGEELDALEQRIGGVLRFFKDTAIELHPGVIAAVEEFLFLRGSGHDTVRAPCKKVYRVLAGSARKGTGSGEELP